MRSQLGQPKSINVNDEAFEGLRILFADDDESLQELMRLELPQMGHRVTVCPNGETAISVLESEVFDCILVDLDMPRVGGMKVVERSHQISPSTEAIILTGKHTFDSAVEAMRFGATDYLTKPCRLAELEALFYRIGQRRELRRKYTALQRQVAKSQAGQQLIGEHDSMNRVRTLIAKVAPTNSTVLIGGETGCGKELVARALHDQSLRKEEPFVAINCGALPENLIESELFGHKKGAFTGADEHRDGLFMVANGGTLFLDEVGELPLPVQAKLLRVLECGEVRRVGDNQATRVDVRVVAATHRDLPSMVTEGSFREDLMFRINTFEIEVPPLRERGNDIILLATHLLSRCRPESEKISNPFSDATIAELAAHTWPGNVRELANVVEHASILCDHFPIEPSHLPRHLSNQAGKKQTNLTFGPMSLKEIELVAIQEAIERHEGDKGAAAEELGISLKTLYNRLNQMELAARKMA